MPAGSSDRKTIIANPIFKLQKAGASRRSVCSGAAYRPRRQNSIKPMPSMP